MAKKIIIDTDPGVDDAMAIQFALNSSELEVIGLTTVFGNVNVDLATINALRLLDIAGHPNIPVARGAENPLVDDFWGGAAFVHGEDGQGNIFKPESSLKAIDSSAIDFIIEQVTSQPHEVTLAALGPLTNLALAMQKAPEIQSLVKEVVLMGGNPFQAGNATPSAEANILGDPHAADIVLGGSWKVTMVPLDVTHRIMLHEDQFAAVAERASSPMNKHVSAAYIFYQDFYKRVNKIDGSYVHDSSVIAYLIDENLFQTAQYPIRVETSNCISKGKTWPYIGNADNPMHGALAPWKDRTLVNLCVDADADKILELLMSRLN